MPGQRAVTATPRSRTSSRKDSLQCRRNAFEPEYPAWYGAGPIPATEATLSTNPRRASSIAGAAPA